MNVLFLGMHRRWILSCLLIPVIWTHLIYAEMGGQGYLNDQVTAPGKGPIPLSSDLVLEFSPDPKPSVLPDRRVLYSLRAINLGPGNSSQTRIFFNFHGGSLDTFTGCSNDPIQAGFCDLGTIISGGTTSVTFTAEVDECANDIVFNGVIGSFLVSDFFSNNNNLSAQTSLPPDSSPSLMDLQPGDGVFIDFDPITFMAEATDVEDDDTTLSQGIEWRSDRVIESLGIGSALTVPVEDLGAGGHKITATVTDSCDNTVSDFVNIGIAPEDPITADNPVTLDSEGQQGQPDVASTGPSSFVVVWSDLDENGEDTDGSVRAQRFSSDGSLMGNEIRVNETTEGLQHRPAVAGLRDGSFVVVWQGSPDIKPNSSLANIFLRQFDSSGRPSDEQQVSISTGGGQMHPDVATRPDGGFLVAWEGSLQADLDSEIFARFFDRSGIGLDEFQVNSYVTGNQGRPTLVATPEGEFVAAWQSEGSLGNDDDGYSIQLRRIDEELRPKDPEGQLNRIIEGNQTDPSMDGNSNGQLAIVWKGVVTSGQKRTLRIGGGTANSFGEWSEGELEVFEPIVSNLANPWTLFSPDVALSPDGDFLVIWADGPDSANLFSVQALPFLGLGNSPQAFGSPLSLDLLGLGLPAIAYSRSDVAKIDFSVFWEARGEEAGSPLEGTMGILDISGSRVSLPISPLQADLSLTISDVPDPVTEGEPLAFNIRVDNLGPADSVGVEVVAELPNDWTFLSSPDCAPPSPDIICQLGTVQVGEARNLTINGFVHLGAPASIAHRAQVFSETPGTTDVPVIATGTTEVLPRTTELSLTVSDTPDPVTEGRPLAFTIQVENVGPADALATEVVAELPSAWTFLSSPDCDPPSPDVICQLGTVQVGETRSLVVNGFVHLSAPATIEHRVEVISASPGPTEDPVIIEGTTAVLPQSRVGLLFYDGFESGDTSAWDASETLNSVTPGFED